MARRPKGPIGEMLPFEDWGRQISDETSHEGFVEELVEQRFVAVQGIPTEQIEEMMRAYEQVMQLPRPSEDYLWDNYHPGQDEVMIRPELDREKYWHVYRTRLDKPGKPGGLTDRSAEYDALSARGFTEREASDRKEYFHYLPEMHEELKALHDTNGWGPIPSDLVRFMQLAEPIHERAAEIMEGCLYAMEHHTAFNGISKRLLADPTWRASSPMRILAYHSDGDGEMLGQLHRDKGTATLAIDESHAGLRVSTKARVHFNGVTQSYVLENREEAGSDEGMELIQRERGTAAFFVADGFSRETGILEPGAEPTYHDIVRVDDKQFSDVIARYAVILFMNPPTGTFSTKSSNHGSQQ